MIITVIMQSRQSYSGFINSVITIFANKLILICFSVENCDENHTSPATIGLLSNYPS